VKVSGWITGWWCCGGVARVDLINLLKWWLLLLGTSFYLLPLAFLFPFPKSLLMIITVLSFFYGSNKCVYVVVYKFLLPLHIEWHGNSLLINRICCPCYCNMILEKLMTNIIISIHVMQTYFIACKFICIVMSWYIYRWCVSMFTCLCSFDSLSIGCASRAGLF
jgi:hypothetical protein